MLNRARYRGLWPSFRARFVRRRLTGAAAAFVVVANLVAASPVTAETFDDNGTTTVTGAQTDDGGAAFVDSIIGRHGRAAHHGSSSGVTCADHSVSTTSPLGELGPIATDLVEGMNVWRVCTDSSGSVISAEFLTIGPRNPRALALLAVQRAIAAISVELPVADSSPANHVTVPNIATWFWVSNTDPDSSTAAVGGVAATVRSTFRGASFEAGDRSVRCADGGHPYDLNLADDRQTSACVIRFAPPNHHIDVDVTATWHLSWTATNGEAGDLGDVERTSAIPLDIHELHTVIRNS